MTLHYMQEKKRKKNTKKNRYSTKEKQNHFDKIYETKFGHTISSLQPT